MEEWVGVLVCVFIHQPPWLLILQHGSQVATLVTIPPKLESASFSEGKYSVGTNGVLL